jgi:hypothetical protein
MPASSRRGPKGLPDLLYTQIACDYMDAFEAGSRSPALDVARRRSGGAATDRARMILAAQRRGRLCPFAVSPEHPRPPPRPHQPTRQENSQGNQ